MFGYLRLHPNVRLSCYQSCFVSTAGCFHIEIDQVDLLKAHFLPPEAYHVASVKLLQAVHTGNDLSVVAVQPHKPHDNIKFVLAYKARKTRYGSPKGSTISNISTKDTPPINPDAFAHGSGEAYFGPDFQARYTESFIAANLSGGIFENTPYLDFAVSMSGRHVHSLFVGYCTAAENTTKLTGQPAFTAEWAHSLAMYGISRSR
jgi:hypothetical protein